MIPPVQNNAWAPVVTFPNLFSQQECEDVIGLFPETLEKSTVQGTIAQGHIETEHFRARVGFLPHTETNDALYRKIYNITQQTNNECWNFDLYGMDLLRLAKYGTGDELGWHLDINTAESSLRKISFVILLSDDHEGGDLEFLIGRNNRSAKRGIGTVILFPSYVMHRVTPVTKGVRKTLVGWVIGPPYR